MGLWVVLSFLFGIYLEWQLSYIEIGFFDFLRGYEGSKKNLLDNSGG
jgi:hypothetical protein